MDTQTQVTSCNRGWTQKGKCAFEQNILKSVAMRILHTYDMQLNKLPLILEHWDVQIYILEDMIGVLDFKCGCVCEWYAFK